MRYEVVDRDGVNHIYTYKCPFCMDTEYDESVAFCPNCMGQLQKFEVEEEKPEPVTEETLPEIIQVVVAQMPEMPKVKKKGWPKGKKRDIKPKKRRIRIKSDEEVRAGKD